MDDYRIQELKRLLDNAMPHIGVFMGHGSNTTPAPGISSSIDLYRENLKLSRALSVMRIDPYFDRCYLKIQDVEANDKLMDAIVTALAPFFHDSEHDDKKQTAFAFIQGSKFGGYYVSSVVQTLLECTVLYGTDAAACQFYEELEEPAVGYQRISLLAGIHIDQEMEMSNGIRMVPLPSSTNTLPAFLPKNAFDLNNRFFLNKTVLVRDCADSPKFVAPAKMPEDDSWPELFTSTEPDLDGVKFDVDEFCDALSLIVDHPIRMVGGWFHSNPDEVFGKHNNGSNSTWHRTDILVSQGAPKSTTPSDIESALQFYRDRRRLDSKDADKLRISVHRLIKESIQHDLVDAVVDLGIALESLYLPTGGGELTFRLAIHAAWYLESDPAKRQALMGRIKHFYVCRSEAVHNGILKDRKGERAPNRLRDYAHQICRRSIMKIIEDGGFPDWDKLVTGEG